MFDLLILVFVLADCLLRFFGYVSEGYFVEIFVVLVVSLSVKLVITSYLRFLEKVREGDGFMRYNRDVHFLNFDALKFVLVAMSIIGIIYLGINKVLNDQTTAALLGGLVGSLLTMAGSYYDLKFTREEKEALNGAAGSQK